MQKILITIIFFVAIFVELAAQSDSTITLTLKQAQERALLENIEKRNAELDVVAAKKKVWETTAIGLPQVSASYAFQFIPGDIPAIAFFDSNDVPGLPPENYEPIPLAVKNSATYNVTVSQLIFSGEYIVGLQASKTYKLISELNSEKKASEVKAGAITSYSTILMLQSNIEIFDSSIVNMEKLVQENKIMLENGFVEETDVDQLNLTFNNLLTTRKSLDRNLKISKDLLKILLNIDMDINIELSDNLNSMENEFIVPGDELLQFNLSDNLDYKMLENQVDASELMLKREKSAYLPTLSAFYQYSDKTNAPAFDFTINHIVGINASLNLFTSGQRNAKVQQAKIELEKTENTLDLMAKNITLQANTARNVYFNAMDNYKNEKMNVELSKRIFSNTQKKYKEGLASSYELTEANNQYLDSNRKYFQSLIELINAKVEYQKINNNL